MTVRKRPLVVNCGTLPKRADKSRGVAYDSFLGSGAGKTARHECSGRHSHGNSWRLGSKELSAQKIAAGGRWALGAGYTFAAGHPAEQALALVCAILTKPTG
jgi:hypothetical protein